MQLHNKNIKLFALLIACNLLLVGIEENVLTNIFNSYEVKANHKGGIIYQNSQYPLCEQNHSSYFKLNGTNCWYMIKMLSESEIEIKDITIRYVINASENREIGYLLYIGNPFLHGSEFQDKDFIAVSLFDDFYFRIKTNLINWSYQHFRSYDRNYRLEGEIRGSFRFLPPVSYFIYIVSADAACVEIWINSTNRVNFSILTGDDIYLYSREDFIGKLNTGCRWGTFILDGEIRFKINNSFIGWLAFAGSNGLAKIECIPPSGNPIKMNEIDWKGKAIYTNGSLNMNKFIIGGNGTWILKANIVNGGFLGSNLLLLGADIPIFPIEDNEFG